MARSLSSAAGFPQHGSFVNCARWPSRPTACLPARRSFRSGRWLSGERLAFSSGCFLATTRISFARLGKFTCCFWKLPCILTICSLLHGLGSMAPAQAYVPEKTPLLSVLEGIRLASLKFWNGVVRFAPVAVFALFADLAGTIRPRAMAEVSIFLFLFFTGALILTFWIVPGCIAAFTPFKHKRGAAGPQVSTPDRCRDYAFRFRAALHFFRNPTPGQGLWH